MAKRASISLSAQDLDDLARIVSSESASRVLDVDPGASEASVLHRVFELGLKQAFEQLDEEGYRELATDPERDAYTQMAKARRRG
ncbi:MAG: hypothetical protein WDZ57_01655 [Demequina sp.]